MLYHLGVEDMEPNHWIAYVFELPACYSSAQTRAEAIGRASAAIADHLTWLSQRGRAPLACDTKVEVAVAEDFRSYTSEGDYIVNAFFADDRRPLARADIEEASWLLHQTRRDLLALVQQISTERLTQPIAGEARGSIAGILDHIAWAEWWYFDRLNLSFARNEMPADPFAKLEKVRAQTMTRLSELIGNERVVEKSGEQWSARKVLRRALWHERDHTQQIAPLIHEQVTRS